MVHLTSSSNDSADRAGGALRVHPLAHLAHSLLGYRHGTLLDPRYLVFEPNAFGGVQRTEQYERALRIVAGRHGADADRRTDPIESPLPRVICGAPSASADTGSCGFLLTTNLMRGKRYYVSKTCDRHHHATSAPQHLERVVRDMVEAAFSESNLSMTVDRVVERSHAVQHDLRKVERDLGRAQALYERMARLEAEASIADDVRNFEHYRDERLRYQVERDRFRDFAGALHAELEGHRSADDVRLILQEAAGLAKDLGGFLDAVQHDLVATRQLLGLLTRTIRVRNLTRWLAVVEIEFTHGARATNVFVTDAFRSGHGERVWARARLAAGASIEVVTSELQRYNPIMSTDSPHSADRTLTLALSNQWFEFEASRLGPHERLDVLAGRTGVSLDEARSAFVHGLLGPGQVSARHEILVAPTDEELRAFLPTYQARQVAKAMRWPIADAVSLNTLSDELDLPAAFAPSKYLTKDFPRQQDEFGRLYTRRSLFLPKLEALASQYHARHAERMHQIRLDSLRAVGLPEWLSDDLHLAGPLARDLQRRLGYPSRAMFDMAFERGDILMIPLVRTAKRSDSIGAASRLVYIPKEVVRATERATVEHWICGGYPLPTATSTRASLKRLDASRRKGRRQTPRPEH